MPQFVGRLVLGKAFGDGGRALNENSARRAAIDRMKVLPVFDLGAIGVAELFVPGLLLSEFLVVRNVQRHMMRRAYAEDPAALLQIRLVLKDDRAVRAALTDFKAMIGAFLTSLAEAERFDEEVLFFLDLAHGEHGAIE